MIEEKLGEKPEALIEFVAVLSTMAMCLLREALQRPKELEPGEKVCQFKVLTLRRLFLVK